MQRNLKQMIIARKENHAEDRRRRSRCNRLSKKKGGLIQKNAFRVGDLYTKEDNRVTNEGEGGEEVQRNLGRTSQESILE